MSEDCLFCQIVAGEIPSHTVHETDEVYAFLDVNPLAKGHTLVIPKAHRERVDDLPAATGAALGEAISELTPAVQAAVDAPATTIAFNNGTEAGQEVEHVHAHIVPRFADDGAGAIHAMFAQTVDVADDEMAAITEEIAGR